MRERLIFIIEFTKAMCEKFPEIKFRCEFDPRSLTYIMEVMPLEVYKNPEYSELEYDFSREFESAFPGYTIMFVSEESLVSVSDPFLITECVEVDESEMQFEFGDSKYINQNHAIAA